MKVGGWGEGGVVGGLLSLWARFQFESLATKPYGEWPWVEWSPGRLALCVRPVDDSASFDGRLVTGEGLSPMSREFLYLIVVSLMVSL